MYPYSYVSHTDEVRTRLTVIVECKRTFPNPRFTFSDFSVNRHLNMDLERSPPLALSGAKSTRESDGRRKASGLSRTGRSRKPIPSKSSRFRSFLGLRENECRSGGDHSRYFLCCLRLPKLLPFSYVQAFCQGRSGC